MGKFAFDNFSFLTLQKSAHLSAYLFIVEEAYACHYVHMWTSRQPEQADSLLPFVRPGFQTQVSRLGGMCLCCRLLGHLAHPCLCF